VTPEKIQPHRMAQGKAAPASKPKPKAKAKKK
jgi:hypothetical protein